MDALRTKTFRTARLGGIQASSGGNRKPKLLAQLREALRRHHVHETILQRAVKEAVGKGGVVKHVEPLDMTDVARTDKKTRDLRLQSRTVCMSRFMQTV